MFATNEAPGLTNRSILATSNKKLLVKLTERGSSPCSETACKIFVQPL